MTLLRSRLSRIAPVLLAATLAFSISPLLQSRAEGDSTPKKSDLFAAWKHSGVMSILTTRDGADLPASATEEGFPLLVRLDKDWFDFSQAQVKGGDVRFSAAGKALAYQIEEWDATKGVAVIWVRIPMIKGNAHQELQMSWGKEDADSESDGKAVFNESNGYAAVFHLEDATKDETGALSAKDLGTEAVSGMIGQGRHFTTGKGIACGDSIATFPMGSAPHSTEFWFRAEKSGERMVCWGNGGPKMMVQMILSKPPKMVMDCYGSGSSLTSPKPTPLNEWVHVIHTCKLGESRMYVNGEMVVVSMVAGNPLDFKSPVKMSMGGWGNYGFNGDLDEVRVSKVVRSADWVRLQYENQKPRQTVVGPLVQPGSAFAVSEKVLTLAEGQHATITAKAGGAEKIYWIIKRGGEESVVAADRFAFTLDAGRVVGDETLTVQCKAVFANEVKTIDIPVTIKEAIADPIFTLKAPPKWDGRELIEVVPQVANLSALQGKGMGELTYRWKVAGPAVIKEIAPGRLMLRRSLGSGKLTVTCVASNGGREITQALEIAVEEPAKETWVQRIPEKEEKPVDNQFFARDDHNEGTLFYNGTLAEPADAVFLRLYADDKLVKTETQKPQANGSYGLSAKLKAGLIVYKVEFGTKIGGAETLRQTVKNLVCGDAYIIEGQSNAVGYNYENTKARQDLTHTDSPWIRSFGGNGEVAGDPLTGGWGNARVERINPTDPDRIHFISAWGMALAKKLVEDVKMPICVINGAVGGTRLDEHLPQRIKKSPKERAIYENLKKRIIVAKLTHGMRGLLWHQGEADQGFDGPDNCYGSETYEQYWVDLTAAWKQDYPNLRNYYLFQIYPNACSQGGTWHSDKLREVQRQLSQRYSSLSVMPTLQIASGANCHFKTDDYEKMGLLMAPLLERDIYGKVFTVAITAPDLKKAYFTSKKRDEIALEFDQPMEWNDAIAPQLYLDGEPGKVTVGAVEGNVIKLKLASATEAKTITYLSDKKWDRLHLLFGKNGIAALTFWGVEVH